MSLPKLHLTLPQTSLWFNLEVSATRFPHKPAFVFCDGITTYAQFKQQAEWLAGFLQQECGVRRGDRVALFMQNSPQFAIAYYAILRADAVVVPINCMNVGAELAAILTDAGAGVMITAQDLYPRAAEAGRKQIRHTIVACYRDYIATQPLDAVPELTEAPRQFIEDAGVTHWDDALSRAFIPAPHRSSADDLCVIPYTSGTTGRSKGCMHRHRAVLHTALGSAHWSDLRQDDTSLAVLPFFHVTGMQSGMNMPIYAGATVIILPRWNKDVAAALIERYHVTVLTAVTPMIVDLVSNADVARYNLSSLKVLSGGGAVMPDAVAQRLREVYGLTYVEGYGLTETMAPTHGNPVARPKPHCLGIPIYDTDSRIIDPATLAELPQGEVGEIIVHGPQVLETYWNRPEENATCFITLDGKRFLRTGDLGRIDEDGYFHFVDRLKRMINTSGFKVWPAEVESLLYAHPAVQEAVVIGKRDERVGERVKALIVLRAHARDAVTAEELIDWARERMAAYKVPREIELVHTLPRSGTGKVDWRALQEKEAERR
jgi:fatty-acyl-CoA synthase